MSKKLFLGLILCVGLQALNAADQGNHPAQPERAEAGQALALVGQREENQLVPFNQDTANAHQVAAAAGALALRAGAELVQQGVPAARDAVRRGIIFSLEQIFEAGGALAQRHRRDGVFPVAGAVAAGGATCLAFGAIAEKFVPTWLALTVGTIVGARATRAAADNWNSFVGWTFEIKVSENQAVRYSSNNPNFERDTLERTLYPTDDHRGSYTITYEIRPYFGTNLISETRTCTTLKELQIILDELQRRVQQAQQ